MKPEILKTLRTALTDKLREALVSVLPISLIVLAVSLTPLVHLEPKELLVFCVSAVFLILGIGLFNLGADLAMTPMGEQVGEGLTKSRRLSVLLTVCFAMGVLITIAEPDLSVLATQVSAVIPETRLITAVGVGVGLFLLLAVLKIVLKIDLSTLLLFFYMLLFALAALLLDSGKAVFLPLSFDSGGVTTGPITVPFIMALGVGIAMTVGGKGARENSFGLVALCSIGPVAAVMVLSLLSDGELSYQLSDYSMEANLGPALWRLVCETMGEVAKSLGLIVLFFAVLQVTVLKLPRRKIIQILVGIIYTFTGLTVFLAAVTVGFMPVGFRLGQELAGSRAALTVFAFVVGAVVVLAEPAVHVLNRQVEEVTNGAVTKKQMLIALSAGVGVSIGLSVLRALYREVGLNTAGQGIAFSLPVSQAVGLTLPQNAE